MSTKWTLRLTAAVLCCSVFSSPADAQTAPPPTPPQANLKLIPVERVQSEAYQVWIESTSLTRKGYLADVWILRAFQSDSDSSEGMMRAVWLKKTVDCQQRTSVDLAITSIKPTGELGKTDAFGPMLPLAPRPQSSNAKMIDAVCTAAPPGTPFADTIALAVSTTRSGTPLPRPAAASAQPLSAWMKRECAVNYITLSDLAGLRRNKAYLGETISDADIATLEAAVKAYKQRSYQTDPTLPGMVAASESIRRYKAYEQAPGDVHSPAKMAALERLKYPASECDRMLGLTAIPLP